MNINPYFFALIVIVVFGHFIWFIHYALKILKGEEPKSPKSENLNEQDKF